MNHNFKEFETKVEYWLSQSVERQKKFRIAVGEAFHGPLTENDEYRDNELARRYQLLMEQPFPGQLSRAIKDLKSSARKKTYPAIELYFLAKVDVDFAYAETSIEKEMFDSLYQLKRKENYFKEIGVHLSRQRFDDSLGLNGEYVALVELSASEQSNTFTERLEPTFPRNIRLEDSYQKGRKEFEKAKTALVSKDLQSVGITAAVHGTGGYGKTALAEELSLDKGVRRAFPGGIYWLQFGLRDSRVRTDRKQPRSLEEAIRAMLIRQYGRNTSDTIESYDDDIALESLIAHLPRQHILLIADDLWTERQISWIVGLPGHVSVLATTRVKRFNKRFNSDVEIKRLIPEASFRLLTHNIGTLAKEQTSRFEIISEAFAGWPLMLRLANSTIKTRLTNGVSMGSILNDVEEYALLEDIKAWDAAAEIGEEEDEARRKFVGACIEAGLSALGEKEFHNALLSMGVFPDDTDVPFDVVAAYWQKMTEDHSPPIKRPSARTILDKLNDLSFFRDYDGANETLQIHDVFLAYFRSTFSPSNLSKLHEYLVNSLKEKCDEGWASLPHEHQYGWQNLLLHMEAAGQIENANCLRTDFEWIKSKYNAAGSTGLLRSFISSETDESARAVGRALQLSAAVIEQHPSSLAHQLYGRIGHASTGRIAELVSDVLRHKSCWPRPVRPHLPPPGPELLRLKCDDYSANGVAFSPDGTRIVTTSPTRNPRTWDAQTGEEIQVFTEFSGQIWKAVFDKNNTRLLTTSNKWFACLRDVDTAETVREFRGHRGLVLSATFNSCENKILTSSSDNTVRLWDIETGAECIPALQHRADVTSAVICKESLYISTVSNDGFISTWDATTGTLIAQTFNQEWVLKKTKLSAGGEMVAAISSHNSIKIWDTKELSNPKHYFECGSNTVSEFDFSKCGGKFFATSTDGAKIWDIRGEIQLISRMERNHDDHDRQATFSECGRMLAVSDGGFVRVWNTEITSTQYNSNQKHKKKVTAANFNRYGKELVTVSRDSTLRVWDAKSGNCKHVLEGHRHWVVSADFSPCGYKVISGSYDRTARIWDLESGPEHSYLKLPHGMHVIDVAFCHCGKTVTSTTISDQITMWDVASKEVIMMFQQPRHLDPDRVFFSPTGDKALVARFVNYTADIVETVSFRHLTNTLDKHKGSIISAAFSPCGEMVATASEDYAAIIWNANTGKALSRIDFDSVPTVVSWSASTLAFGLDDGRVSFFHTD